MQGPDYPEESGEVVSFLGMGWEEEELGTLHAQADFSENEMINFDYKKFGSVSTLPHQGQQIRGFS